jgi:hypothetical protein
LEEIMALSNTTHREYRTAEGLGDGSVMADYNYSGYLIGKVLWFQERNVLCYMQFYAFTSVPGDVTDGMMVTMAHLQLEKMK